MAGGSSVPPTAPEERNRTAAAPCNQYATPGLSGASDVVPAEGLHCTRTGDQIDFGLRISTAARLAAVLLLIEGPKSEVNWVARCHAVQSFGGRRGIAPLRRVLANRPIWRIEGPYGVLEGTAV